MANKSIKDSFQRFWQHCVSSFATKEYVDNAVGNAGGGGSGGGGASGDGGRTLKTIVAETFDELATALSAVPNIVPYKLNWDGNITLIISETLRITIGTEGYDFYNYILDAQDGYYMFIANDRTAKTELIVAKYGGEGFSMGSVIGSDGAKQEGTLDFTEASNFTAYYF